MWTQTDQIPRLRPRPQTHKNDRKKVCEIALKVINACESVSRIGSLEIKDDLTSAGKHAGMLLKDIMKTARDQISEKSKKPAS